jgi:diguanylate cyclase (GGDEF)-like protein
LPDTKVDAAIIVAEHIRNAIEEQKFSFAGNELSVTMTFGVTQHKQGNTIYDTIKQADDVLYIGKETGRNSVVSL